MKDLQWSEQAPLHGPEDSLVEKSSWDLQGELKKQRRCEHTHVCVCMLTMGEACFWYHWGEKDASCMERSSRGSSRDR